MNYKCKNENLKIKNLTTGFLERMPMNVVAKFVKFSRDKAIIVVGYDKSGKPLMWGAAQNREVIGIEFTNSSLKVFVDYESK